MSSAKIIKVDNKLQETLKALADSDAKLEKISTLLTETRLNINKAFWDLIGLKEKSSKKVTLT